MAHSATLNWSAPSSGDAPSSYIVQRATVTGGVVGAFSTIATVPAPTTTYVDSTVLAGDSYEYQVAAENSAGESAFVQSTVQVVPLAAPGPVLNLTVTLA